MVRLLCSFSVWMMLDVGLIIDSLFVVVVYRCLCVFGSMVVMLLLFRLLWVCIVVKWWVLIGIVNGVWVSLL